MFSRIRKNLIGNLLCVRDYYFIIFQLSRLIYILLEPYDSDASKAAIDTCPHKSKEQNNL